MLSNSTAFHWIYVNHFRRIVMAHTKGQKTSHPCPVCLVPKKALSAYRRVWKYRDPNKAFELATIAQNSRLPAEERARATKRLNAIGFRPHIVSIKIRAFQPRRSADVWARNSRMHLLVWRGPMSTRLYRSTAFITTRRVWGRRIVLGSSSSASSPNRGRTRT